MGFDSLKEDGSRDLEVQGKKIPRNFLVIRDMKSIVKSSELDKFVVFDECHGRFWGLPEKLHCNT